LALRFSLTVLEVWPATQEEIERETMLGKD
jgi:hypothetical protein